MNRIFSENSKNFININEKLFKKKNQFAGIPEAISLSVGFTISPSILAKFGKRFNT